MKKYVSLFLAALITFSFCTVAYATDAAAPGGASGSGGAATDGTGALPRKEATVVSYEALEKTLSSIWPEGREQKRAEAAQRDEIKVLLASFRADSVTMLVADAHAPAGTRIPLSTADTAAILKNLQAMELALYTPEEYEAARRNPMTGGGHIVYLEQGSLRCEVSDGGFFTIRYGDDNTSFMFKSSSNGGRLADLFSSMLFLFDSTAACSIVPPRQLTKTFSATPEFAKQQELDAYRSWATSLDLRKLTKIQYAPFAYSGPAQTLKPTKMDVLLDALRSTEQLAVFSEPQNPTTGGSDFAYLHYDGKPVLLSWGGTWLTVQLPDWLSPLIFNMREVPAWADVSSLRSPMELFEGQPVAELYALDTAGGLTARLPSFAVETLTALEEYKRSAVATAKSTGCGFLVYTQAGREYVYLKEGAPVELLTLCRESLAANPAAIQWFTHMNGSNLISAHFSPYDKSQSKTLDITVLDRRRLDAVAAFLKTQLRPTGACTVTKGRVNPAAEGADGPVKLSFVLDFQSGGSYVCSGIYSPSHAKDASFSVYSTELDTTMNYPVTSVSYLTLCELAQKGFVPL